MGLVAAFEKILELGGQRSRRAMQVQSLTFDKSHGWTVAKAKRWASSHGYRSSKVDETEGFVHLRQRDPSEFRVIRTARFGEGISARVGR